MLRRIVSLACAAGLLVGGAPPVAGGWVVVTVLDPPREFRVGKPTVFEYRVRQHGQELLGDLNGTVTAKSGTAKVTGVVVRSDRGYAATLTVPSEGEWTVTIESGFYAHRQALLPIAAVAAGGSDRAALSDAAWGRHLFVSKGCTTCHLSREVPESGLVTVGPEIVPGRLGGDYIGGVLADPTTAATRTGSMRMPKLELTPAESASLVAFVRDGIK